MRRPRLKQCPTPTWRRAWTGSEARIPSAECFCSLCVMPPSIWDNRSHTRALPASFHRGRKMRGGSRPRKKRLRKTNNECRTKQALLRDVEKGFLAAVGGTGLLRRQAYVEAEHRAIGKISGGRFAVLGGQSPERSVFGLDDCGGKSADGGVHTEYVEGLHNAGCRRRELDDVSVRGRAAEVGHPEIAVAAQKQANRKAGSALTGIERKQLQVAAILLNFKHSLA